MRYPMSYRTERIVLRVSETIAWLCVLGLVALGWYLLATSDFDGKSAPVRRVTIVKHVTVDNQAPATIEGCPQEDSCRIDYHDGRWYVTPQVP